MHKTIKVTDQRICASALYGTGIEYTGTAVYEMGVTHNFVYTEYKDGDVTMAPRELPGSVTAEVMRRIKSSESYRPW